MFAALGTSVLCLSVPIGFKHPRRRKNPNQFDPSPSTSFHKHFSFSDVQKSSRIFWIAYGMKRSEQDCKCCTSVTAIHVGPSCLLITLAAKRDGSFLQQESHSISTFSDIHICPPAECSWPGSRDLRIDRDMILVYRIILIF